MSILLSALAIALFLAAALTDLRWRRIPNPLVGALTALALARIAVAIASGGGLALSVLDLGAALALFALGALLFQLSLLGGGDVKLLAAGALWTGAAALAPFLALTALAGGGLALGFLAWMGLARLAGRTARPSLPYGVAIAAGGILTTIGLF